MKNVFVKTKQLTILRLLLVVVSVWNSLLLEAPHQVQAAALAQTGPQNWLVTSTADTTGTNCPDSSNCTLRQAIQQAKGGDTITFASSLTGKIILLSNGPLELTKNLTINGLKSQGDPIISGNNVTAIFQIDAGINVAMNRLRLTKGNNNSDGGAIINNGALTIKDSSIDDNVSLKQGGGIMSSGSLSILSSTILTNTAATNGGGIMSSGSLSISSSTISGNTAATNGGGLYLETGNSSISSSAVISNTTSQNGSGNNGGGIYTSTNVKITNGTLSGNNGGAIYSTDSSISTLSYVTVSNTNASGDGTIVLDGSSTLVMSNTVIIGNTGSYYDVRCRSAQNITSNGFNITENISDCTSSWQSTDIFPKQWQTVLSGLGPHGGPTYTHALLPGSPAIDVGSCYRGDLLDQRGLKRPVGSACDVGAYEYPSNSPNPPMITGMGGQISYSTNSTPVSIVPGVSVTDTDSPDFNQLVISVTNAAPSESLSIPSQSGLITFDSASSTISYNGMPFGTLAGNQTNQITINFNTYDTLEAVQALIQSIQYQNTDITKTTPANRTITFQLTDSSNQSGTASQTIQLQGQDTPPTLLRNLPLDVDRLATQVIPSSKLSAIDTDAGTSDQQIIYVLSAVPLYGQLYRNGRQLQNKDTFTQKDINDGLLSYKQDGSVVFSDGFRFNLTNPPLPSNNTLSDFKFWININAPFQLDLNGSSSGVDQIVKGNINKPINLVDSNAQIIWSSNRNLISMTAVLMMAPDSNNEALSISTSGKVVSSYDPSTKVLTLWGPASVVDFQSSLRTLTYQNSAYAPSPGNRIIQVRGWNDSGGSALATITVISILPPIITLPLPSPTYTEGMGLTLLDPSALITDTNTVQFKGAVLSLTMSTTISGDQLSVVNQGSGLGQVSVNADKLLYQGVPIGTLVPSSSSPSFSLDITFDGPNVPLEAVQATLRALAFRATAQPLNPTTRLINVSFNDGVVGIPASGAVTKQVRISAVNDPPFLTLPLTQTVAPQVILTLKAEVSDPDALDGNLLVTLSVQNGILSLGSSTGLLCDTGTSGPSLRCQGKLNALNTALASLSYRSNAGFSGIDQLSISVSDQGNTGNPGDPPQTASGRVAIVVQALPQISLPGPVQTYTPGGPAANLDATALLTDTVGVFSSAVLTANYQSCPANASLLLQNPGSSSTPILAVNQNLYYLGNLVASYTTTNKLLTIQFSTAASQAAVQATLRALALSTSSSSNTVATCWVQISYSNGAGRTSSDLLKQINIAVAQATPTLSVDLNGSAPGLNATLQGDFSISLKLAEQSVITPSTDLITLTATLSNFPDGANELLKVTPSGRVVSTYNPGTGVLTLTGPAPAAEFQTVLKTLTYQNGALTPSLSVRTVRVLARTAVAQSPLATITILPLQLPVLALPSPDSLFTENQQPALIDKGALITDTNTVQFDGAVLTAVLSPSQPGDGLLVLNQGLGFGQIGVKGDVLLYQGIQIGTITPLGPASTLTIRFSGQRVPLAAVQATLRQLAFTSPGPALTSDPRLVSLTFEDGLANVPKSRTVTKQVLVSSVNDPPFLTLPLTQTVAPQTDLMLKADVFDPDALNGALLMTLSAQTGTISLSSSTGLNCSTGTSGPSLQCRGPLDALKLALGSLVYRSNWGFSGTDYLNISVNDQGNTGGAAQTARGRIAVVVQALPQVSLPSPDQSYLLGGSLVALDKAALLTDTVGFFGGALLTAALQTCSNSDSLTLQNQGSGISQILAIGGSVYYGGALVGSISGGSGCTPLQISFGPTASLAALQASLRALAFGTTNIGAAGNTRLVQISYSNGPGRSSLPKIKQVMIGLPNLAPSLDVPTATLSTNLDTLIRISGLSISDPDVGTGVLTLTLNITSGQIQPPSVNGVSCSVNAGLICTGTLSQLNSALSGITYRPTNGFSGLATLTLTVNDQGNTGIGGAKTDTKTVTILVTAPPTIDLPGGDQSYTEGGNPVLLDSTALFSNSLTGNFDGSTLTATIISGGHVGDLLGVKNGGFGTNLVGVAGTSLYYSAEKIGSITFGSETTPLTIMFSANVSVQVVQAVLRSITYRNTSADPHADPRLISLVFRDLQGRESRTKVRQVLVSDINNPPNLRAPTTLAVSAGSTSLIAGLSVEDPDARDLPLRLTVAATLGQLGLNVPPPSECTSTGTSLDCRADLAKLNDVLKRLSYSVPAGLGTTGIISMTVDDLGNTGGGGPKRATWQTSVSVQVGPLLPTISLPSNDPNFIEKRPPVALDNNAQLVSPSWSPAGSTLTISFTSGMTTSDQLFIPSQGFAANQIGIVAGNPSQLFFGGSQIGTLTGDSPGAGVLSITFNATAQSSQVQAVLQAILFNNTSANPGATSRLVQVWLTSASGQIGPQTIKQIIVTPVNDPPRLERKRDLYLNGAASGLISSELLRATDPDNPPNQLLYTLNRVPRYGQLWLDQLVLNSGNSFSQRDIDLGRLKYVGQDQSAERDSFDFSVTDGLGTPISAVYTIFLREIRLVPQVYLPLVRRSIQPSGPDLVGNLSLSPAKLTFSAGEPVQITVTVTNRGDQPAGVFWTDLYINPSAPPTTVNQRWDTRCGMQPCYGIGWYVPGGLAPGASITLTSTPGSYLNDYAIWPGWFASGTSDLYLYVDSWDQTGATIGSVLETDEFNNRAELHGLQVTGPNPTALADYLTLPLAAQPTSLPDRRQIRFRN